MILRDIPKKIRQIGLRTKHVAIQTLAALSFQPAAQVGGISRTVPHGNHLDLAMLFIDGKINCIWPAQYPRFAAFAAGQGKSKRLRRNRRHHGVNLKYKTCAKSFGFAFISGHGFPKLSHRLEIVDHPKDHFLYLSSSSSRNCSHGIPRPGFFKASSARRSSSAICSGVSSSLKSPNSFSMVSTSSRRSASGIRRSSSRISVALMSTIYPVDFFVQAGFSQSRITLHTPREPSTCTHIVNGSSRRGHVRIPTGFRPIAKGCEERATLGHRRTDIINRNAVASVPVSSISRDVCPNPVGVVENFIPPIQGGSCVATLGWMTQSLWDWFNAQPHVSRQP